MVAKDIRWIRLFDPENHNILWPTAFNIQILPGMTNPINPSSANGVASSTVLY